MRQAWAKRIRRIFLIILLLMIGPLAGIALYIGAAVILGAIPVNTEFREADGGVPIYIRSNGIHTDIAMPWIGPVYDWQTEFPQPPSVEMKPFIAFGLGDRQLYLETPRWGDLRASVAFKAMTGLGRATVRVEFSGLPMADFGDIVIHLSRPQYLRLVHEIRSSFLRDFHARPVIIATPRYALGRSLYFEAIGAYSMFSTCNDWTRRMLAAAGVRTPLWSPLYPALNYQLRQILPPRSLARR